MIDSGGNYFKLQENHYREVLRELTDKLPPYCKEFFRGIDTNTAIKTKVGYARDLYVFFEFIIAKNPLYKDFKIHNIPWSLFEELTPADIDEFLEFTSLYETNGIEHTNGQSGKARKLSTLSKFYRFFCVRNLLNNNPIPAVERPKIPTKQVIILDPEQVDTLINDITTGDKLTSRQRSFHKFTVERDIALVTVFLGTGIRVSELVGLNVNDIDFNENSLRIIRKGGDEDIIYFGNEVEIALKNYIFPKNNNENISSGTESFETEELLSPRQKLLKYPENPDPALFLSIRGSRMAVRSVQEMVNKYSKRSITNKQISPHRFRSTYATRVYEASSDSFLTSKLLGHKNIETVKKYVKFDENRKKSCANLPINRNNETD